MGSVLYLYASEKKRIDEPHFPTWGGVLLQIINDRYRTVSVGQNEQVTSTLEV